MFGPADLDDALTVVRRAMLPTPQYAWPLLAARVGCEVWVKHENHTPIGAFKVRGGLVLIEELCRDGKRPAGLISATRGNHGQSIAFAGRRAGIPVTIVVPNGNAREKNAAMRGLGAELVEAGDDFDDAREVAGSLAASRGLHLVPSFHAALVRGVATYAHELFAAVAGLDAVYVAIGMGSGACGLIGMRDLLGLRTEIVGVVSAHAPAYALSVAAGRVVTTATADTLADGMACRVPDPQALEIIGRGVSRIVQVSDAEVGAAIRAFHEDTHNLAEGAGAAPLAALLQERDRQRGRRVAVILSGGNIDGLVLSGLLAPP
jgi:threonine dehydratase